MAFLTINGFTVDVANEQAAIERTGFGDDLTRAFSGNIQPERTGLVRSFSITTPVGGMDEQKALSGLITGDGHYWAFDTDIYSSKGLGPNTGYTVTMSAAGGKVDGHVQVTSGATLTYDYTMAADFTMMVWKKEGATWYQYAYVYDSSAGTATEYKNGAPHTPIAADRVTNWYAYSSGTHTFDGHNIAGVNTNAPYDDLVIVPYAMTATMILNFYTLVNGGTPFSSLPKLTMAGDIILESSLQVVGVPGTQSLRMATVGSTNLASTLAFDLAVVAPTF